MTEKKPGISSVKIKQSRHETVFQWLRSATFKCVLMDIVAFFLILILFFVVCVPKKYSLTVGSISHETILATKDVVDEVSTQEKKNAAAAAVEILRHAFGLLRMTTWAYGGEALRYQ